MPKAPSSQPQGDKDRDNPRPCETSLPELRVERDPALAHRRLTLGTGLLDCHQVGVLSLSFGVSLLNCSCLTQVRPRIKHGEALWGKMGPKAWAGRGERKCTLSEAVRFWVKINTLGLHGADQ